VTPEQVLDELFGRPTELGVSLACVVMRGGNVIAERYGVRPANDFQRAEQVTPETPLLSWSMAKSITHAAVGLLVADGHLDLDGPAPVPEWADDERSTITLLDLLEMRSGLRFVEDYLDGDGSHCIEMLFGGTDPSFASYAARQPLEHAVGAEFNYSSGTTNIVARIIGDTLAGRSGGSPDERRAVVESFLHDRLFAPVGMTSATGRFDESGDFVGSSYVEATARDFALFGDLYAHDGVTDCGAGTRLLPKGWLDHARTPTHFDTETGFGYGRHWWLWPTFTGSLACHGYEGQYVVVLPDDDVVVAHLGKTDVAHQRGVTMTLARLIDSVR